MILTIISVPDRAGTGALPIAGRALCTRPRTHIV
jgi:hypothetical protein